MKEEYFNIKFYFSTCIFAILGLISMYSFGQYKDTNTEPLIIRGLISGYTFTFITLLCSHIYNVKLSFKQTFYYLAIMITTYTILFFISLFSGMNVIFIGILTSSFGAFSFFYLYKKYIDAISYSKYLILILGSLSFILYIPISKIFKLYPQNPFAITFFIWHFIVGWYFITCLSKLKRR
ncbi:hypothetical protein EGI31_11995 [Lacihabitans soyangensis]|uniref:Uncharacterized protein n=1 Tax=Lacihabitans soyangensis TaxID=869394 RepID=A0AAE3H346_9BACT|nr:hypothetical protein [Lacihabitans soyangensis]